MADDPAALILRMQADLSKLEKDLQGAGVLTDKAVQDIENRFSKANPQFSGIKEGLLQGAGIAISNFIGQSISQLSQALVDVQKQLVAVADTAKLIGASTNRVQELQFAASIGGVSPAEFRKGIEGIGRSLNDSVRGENDLTRLFAANNVQLKDRQGKLISVNEALLRGADLIRNAATEFDKIKIADLLGLSREWVRALEGGSSAFDSLAASASSAGAVIDASTIQKAAEFQRQWETATTRWSVQIKSALAEILPLLETIVQKGADLLGRVNEWSKKAVVSAKISGGYDLDLKEAQTLMATLAANGATPNEEAVQIYNKALKAAIDNAVKLNEASGKLKIEITKPPTAPPTIIPDKTPSKAASSEDAFTRAQEQIVKRIATIEAETSTIGLNTEARDRARTVATLEEAAKQANTRAGKENTEVTAEQRVVIDQLADRYYAAAAASRQAQEAQRSWNDLQQAFGSVALEGISGVIKKTESLSDALQNAASRMVDLLLQASLMGTGPLAGILGFSNTTGGTGGLIGALFSGFGGLPKFADGGVANSPSIFGDAGAEAAVPLPDGRRIPVDLRVPQVTPQTQAVSNTFKISIDLSGANGDAAIAAAARQAAAAGAAAALRATPSVSLRAAADNQKRRG